MFYDVFCELCKNKGKSPNKAAEEIGLSNSITTKWKKTGATPGGDTLHKVARYFGVTTDYLLGKETKKAPAETGKRSISDYEIKFALFRGREDITDAMFEEVLNFAEYVARREEEKKRKD